MTSSVSRTKRRKEKRKEETLKLTLKHGKDIPIELLQPTFVFAVMNTYKQAAANFDYSLLTVYFFFICFALFCFDILFTFMH